MTEKIRRLQNTLDLIAVHVYGWSLFFAFIGMILTESGIWMCINSICAGLNAIWLEQETGYLSGKKKKQSSTHSYTRR